MDLEGVLGKLPVPSSARRSEGTPLDLSGLGDQSPAVDQGQTTARMQQHGVGICSLLVKKSYL